jgi:GYF domain 2
LGLATSRWRPMVRAEAKFAWHLKRGQKIYSPISHGELRLLAELGHLRPEDLLWRPGLRSWSSASSVPGIPPLLPPDDSQTKQRGFTRIGALFSRRMSALFLAALQHARYVKGRFQHTYIRAASRWPNFKLIEVARHRPQGVVAVLLVIAVFVGAVDFAVKSPSATANKDQLATIAPKFHDRPSTAVAAPRTLWTDPLKLKPVIDVKEAEVFNVSNGHPTGGIVRASNQTSESQTQSIAQAPRPTPPLQSEAAAGAEAVPLPTKKPERPSVREARPNTGTVKRIAQRPIGRKPKSMRFGIIGYNYNPQR